MPPSPPRPPLSHSQERLPSTAVPAAPTVPTVPVAVATTVSANSRPSEVAECVNSAPHSHFMHSGRGWFANVARFVSSLFNRSSREGSNRRRRIGLGRSLGCGLRAITEFVQQVFGKVKTHIGAVIGCVRRAVLSHALRICVGNVEQFSSVAGIEENRSCSVTRTDVAAQPNDHSPAIATVDGGAETPECSACPTHPVHSAPPSHLPNPSHPSHPSLPSPPSAASHRPPPPPLDPESLPPPIVDVEGELGSGSFGSVVTAIVHPAWVNRREFRGQPTIALKLAPCTAANTALMVKEYNILKRLERRMPVARPVATLRLGNFIALGMEKLHGCDLHKLISTHGPLPQHTAATVMADVLHCLDVMHNNNIAHMDIKLENVVTVAHRGIAVRSGDVRVVDFGLAIEGRDSVNVLRNPEFAERGTPGYAAPEVLACEQYWPMKADIFSAGVMWALLVSGRHIFHATNMDDYADELDSHGCSAPVNGFLADPGLQHLLNRMVSEQPEVRPSAEEAFYTVCCFVNSCI